MREEKGNATKLEGAFGGIFVAVSMSGTAKLHFCDYWLTCHHDTRTWQGAAMRNQFHPAATASRILYLQLGVLKLGL